MSVMSICKFCEREFEKKNSSHIFCSKDCAYCWSAGKGTPFEGMNYRERSGHRFGWKPEPIAEPVPPKTYIPPERKESKKRERKYLPPLEEKWRGHVYLMRAENGLHKIGRTSNLEKRRQGIEREIPIKVEIIHSFATVNSIKAEAKLHTKYAEHRIRYEWFNLSQIQVDEIKNIRDWDLDTNLRNLETP